MALVAGGTLNYSKKLNQYFIFNPDFTIMQPLIPTSSAANFNTAVNGVFSGTLNLQFHMKSITVKLNVMSLGH